MGGWKGNINACLKNLFYKKLNFKDFQGPMLNFNDFHRPMLNFNDFEGPTLNFKAQKSSNEIQGLSRVFKECMNTDHADTCIMCITP